MTSETLYFRYCLFVLCMLIYISTSFGSDLSENSIINSAKKMLHHRQYTEVIVYLEGLDQSGQNQQTQQLLGQAYFGQKKYQQAIKAFKQSLSYLNNHITQSETSKNTSPQNQISKNHALLTSASLESLTFKTKFYPIRAQIYTWISLCHQKLSNITQALHWSLKSRDLVPDNPIAWTNLGQIYLKSKQYNKAEQTYLTAYRFNPNLRSALYGLLQTYEAKKNYPRAINYGLILIKTYPRQALYYLEIANIYEKQNQKALFHQWQAKGLFLLRQYDQVLDHLNQIQNLNSQIDLYLIWIATLIESKQFDKAKDQLDKAILQYPKNQEFKLNLAQLYYRKSDYQQCLQFSLNTIKQYTDIMHDWYILIGHTYVELDNKKNAIIYYEKALQQQMHDVLTREKLAHIYRQLQQRSLEIFHQGVVYFYLGQLEQAREILSWIEPEFSRFNQRNYYLGLVYWSLNKKQKAIDLFTQTIKKEDNSPFIPLYLVLSRAYYQMKQGAKAKVMIANLLKRHPHLVYNSEIIELKKQLNL